MEGMGLKITSCGEDMLSFRRCLAAAFFLHAARRQLDGTYRYEGSSRITRMFCQYLLCCCHVVSLKEFVVKALMKGICIG